MTLTRDRTCDAVERQVTAMGVDVFEVGLFQSGATPEMIPRTWDKATLLRSVGWLKYQNMLGRNIFVRPKGEHPLSLIDDITRDAVERMKREGFPPCVVIETSPANFQAWVNHGRVLSKAESTAAARWLAERFGGDMSSADWRHFGRLAGFTNRKEKYRGGDGRFPFVGLDVASSCHVVTHLPRHASRRVGLPRAMVVQDGTARTVEDFRDSLKYGGDGNRADLAFAIYAISRGETQSTIEAAIRSRDLSKKGNQRRQMDYVQRTIRKAMTAVRSPRSPAKACDR